MNLTFEQAVVISSGLKCLQNKVEAGDITNNFFSSNTILELIEQVRAKLAED